MTNSSGYFTKVSSGVSGGCMYNSATGGSVGSLSIHVPIERPSHPSMIL